MRAACLFILMALAACAPAPAVETPEVIAARAADAAPADPRLAALYQGACFNCHSQPDSGAPLTLDRAAWNQRWAKGEATLLNHTIAGFNGMPAGGQCFACSADDYRALIRFMAGREE
jgi:cytochrome c5